MSDVKFDIIFVRHGYSCANKINDKIPGTHWIYSDPELTNSGIEKSVSLGYDLLTKIKGAWKNKPYTIGSSQMIRAQETAYYMLSKPTGLPIHIMPHIGEPGYTRDNYSLPLEKQRKMIEDRNPDILDHIGDDAREIQTLKGKSNWDLFIRWAVKNTDMFALGEDGYYRAVIFTHSIFLKKVFPRKEKVKNNDAIHALINDVLEKPKEIEYWNMNVGKHVEYCPDNCYRTHCIKRPKQIKKTRKNIGRYGNMNNKTKKKPLL
jgi:broad specificity phosphatase PhoE